MKTAHILITITDDEDADPEERGYDMQMELQEPEHSGWAVQAMTNIFSALAHGEQPDAMTIDGRTVR